MSYADNLLDAVEIITNKKVSNLQFDKTIQARIVEILDDTLGKYKVKYQDSYFTAYSLNNDRYSKDAIVYIEIISNNFGNKPLILGQIQTKKDDYKKSVIMTANIGTKENPIPQGAELENFVNGAMFFIVSN